MKPCPFCGEDKEIKCYSDEELGQHLTNNYAVRCDYCGAQGPDSSTPSKAWHEWDTRFVEQPSRIETDFNKGLEMIEKASDPDATLNREYYDSKGSGEYTGD